MSHTNAPAGEIDQATLDKIPPQDRQAEMSLLGALMIDNIYIDAARSIVAPDDFYERRHIEIFKAILEINDKAQPADIVTVTDQLVSAGQLEAIGGRAYLVELQEDVYSAANCERYAQIVKEKAILRKLMHFSAEVFKRANEHESPSDVLEFADHKLFKLAVEAKVDKEISPVDSGLAFLKKLDARIYANEHPEEVRSLVRTGFPEVDDLFDEFDDGTFTVLAGRPGQGKSALAQQMAEHLSDIGIASDFFSYEMDEVQIESRRVSWRTRIPHAKIKNGRGLSAEEYAAIQRAVGQESLVKYHYLIDDPGPYTLRRLARRSIRERNSKVIIIDYVQLIEVGGFKANERVAEVSFITRFLKRMARELSVAVIGLCQMNRLVEQRQNKEPQLTDLRESGSIEQDADNVLFVWHPYMDYPDRLNEFPKNHARILLKKSRQNPLGKASLFWCGDLVSFESLAGSQQGLPL